MIEARALTKRYGDKTAVDDLSYTAPNTLSPWIGLAVTVIWVVVMTVAAAIVLRRRDA